MERNLRQSVKCNTLLSRYETVRQASVQACQPLESEDFCLQAAPFVSPPKWHLAHTTWFFETFLLKPFLHGYVTPEPKYAVLFNSYYNGIGAQFPRPQRGLLSRPSLEQVYEYRRYVDEKMTMLLSQVSDSMQGEILQRTELGLQHEQQHQELFFTDIKYSLSKNPLLPAYHQYTPSLKRYPEVKTMAWLDYSGGTFDIGVPVDDDGFYFDNEAPCHQVSLPPFQLSQRLVNNAEYSAFVRDGGYQNPEYWLSDGWATVVAEKWNRPLYWDDALTHEFTLTGERRINPEAPVTHISGYEADAYAAWAKVRLPTEAEWEVAVSVQSAEPEVHSLHPEAGPSEEHNGLRQLFGHCWQWTGSSYRPYPGYKKTEGAMGEYNGKFMCNQWVLRGSSCVTSPGHQRLTYRNFFYPGDRWQFTGIRLARDCE